MRPMSGRSRIAPHIFHLHDSQPPLLGPPLQVVHILDEAPFHRRLPPPHVPLPAVIALEDRLAAQHREIHALLADNQHVAATHVALKQELDASQNELAVAGNAAARARAERDSEVREVLERSVKAEAEALGVEGMRAELVQVRSDVKKLGETRNELLKQFQGLRGELSRAREELGQASAMRADIEAMNREINRGRAAVEYEKKARTENLVQGQEMEKNMISLAREVEKLRVELANAEKRARASAAAAVAANPNLGYNDGYNDAYGNTGMVYGVKAYNMPFDLHQSLGSILKQQNPTNTSFRTRTVERSSSQSFHKKQEERCQSTTIFHMVGKIIFPRSMGSSSFRTSWDLLSTEFKSPQNVIILKLQIAWNDSATL